MRTATTAASAGVGMACREPLSNPAILVYYRLDRVYIDVGASLEDSPFIVFMFILNSFILALALVSSCIIIIIIIKRRSGINPIPPTVPRRVSRAEPNKNLTKK